MANTSRRPVAPIRKVVAAVLGSLAAFVILFGAGMMSWAIVALGVAILVLAFSLALINVVRRGARAWVAGTAHVRAVSEPPASSVYGRCEMQIVVDAPGLPAAAVTVRDPRVPVAKWPDPGSTLPVMVAVDDMRHVRVQWDEVMTHAEAAAVHGDVPPEYGDPLPEDLFGDDVPPWSQRDRQDRPWEAPGGDPPTADLTDQLGGLRDEPVVVRETPGGPIVVEGQLVEPASAEPPPLPKRSRSRPSPRPRPGPTGRVVPDADTGGAPTGTAVADPPRISGLDLPPDPVAEPASTPAPEAEPAPATRSATPPAPQPEPKPAPQPEPEPEPESESAAVPMPADAPAGPPAGSQRVAAVPMPEPAPPASAATAPADRVAAVPMDAPAEPPARPAGGVAAVPMPADVGAPDVPAHPGDTGDPGGEGDGDRPAAGTAGDDEPGDDPAAADQARMDDLITAYPSARAGASDTIRGVGLTVLVTDLDRAVGFYRDLLGFQEIDGGDGNVVLASGDTRLVLRTVLDAAPESRRSVHLNLEVGDIDAVHADLKGRGVRFTYGPRPVNRGSRLELWAAAFRDPDGHGVALTQWKAVA